VAVPRLNRWQAALLAVSAVILLLFLEVLDEQEVDLFELGLEVVEISLIVAACIGVMMLVTRVEDQEQLQQQMQKDLALASEEGAAWRARANELLKGLGSAIDEQFDRWQLTLAEKDVALLLLKGFSHKEVAQLRGRAERTVRQQALAVYRKSKLNGRASLAAYFLEDLLLPTIAPER
jgi:DNA-binding CsgD family transcriptional regulator